MLAAAVMPAKQSQNPAKWSVLNAVNAMMTNISSTPSLMITMMVFTRADSLAPRISSSAHMMMRMTAGRLIVPGSASHGAADNACGICTPNRLSNNLFR